MGGFLYTCGLDEAGRGPLAGPVCAAAVILPVSFDVTLLDDSKKLSKNRRESAMACIYRDALFWAVAWASPDEIDRHNILRASLLAMKRAWLDIDARLGDELRHSVELIVDGLHVPDIPDVNCRAVVGADSQFPAVMAASILAKTARDRMMLRYSWLYPEYGYDRHKGYPTVSHIEALKENGPSPIQRKSFRLKNEGQLALF